MGVTCRICFGDGVGWVGLAHTGWRAEKISAFATGLSGVILLGCWFLGECAVVSLTVAVGSASWGLPFALVVRLDGFGLLTERWCVEGEEVCSGL